MELLRDIRNCLARQVWRPCCRLPTPATHNACSTTGNWFCFDQVRV